MNKEQKTKKEETDHLSKLVKKVKEAPKKKSFADEKKSEDALSKWEESINEKDE